MRPLYNDHTLIDALPATKLLDDARTARFDALRWHESVPAAMPRARNLEGERVCGELVDRLAVSDLRRRWRPGEGRQG
jgi:hypothetical protein